MDSAGSSLAISQLCSPLATARTMDTVLGGGGSPDNFTDASTTRPNTHRTVMAKIEVSDLFMPLERRIQARVDALEADVYRRFGILEAKVGVLVDTAAGSAGDAAAGRPLERERSYTTAEFPEELRQSLQGNMDELWRQLKADRQESVNKFGVLADTMEFRLHSLWQQVTKSCSDITTILDEELKKPAHDTVSRSPAGTYRYMDVHPAEMVKEEEEEDDKELPVLLGARVAAQKRADSEQCGDEAAAAAVFGNSGINRRHSAGPRTLLPPGPSPLGGRSVPPSPPQPPRGSSPSATFVTSPREAQLRARRPSTSDCRATSPQQAVQFPHAVAPAVAPPGSQELRRVTSAPYGASVHLAKQRMKSDTLRSQGLRAQGAAVPRPPQSPLVGGAGGMHRST